MLKVGTKSNLKRIVRHEDTAKYVKSGELNVLATPVLVALMEETACKNIKLDNNLTSVGTFMEINHTSPTPEGLTVECISELIEINNRELTFRIEAFDNAGKIANAVHKRFIVDTNKFQLKSLSKLNIEMK
ncbi:thioesterase family protein [bacterium]|nr:thioesterase family protein [bacterium]